MTTLEEMRKQLRVGLVNVEKEAKKHMLSPWTLLTGDEHLEALRLHSFVKSGHSLEHIERNTEWVGGSCVMITCICICGKIVRFEAKR